MTPEQIAAGLTEAQKHAMTYWPCADYYGHHEVYPKDELPELIALGLCGGDNNWPDRMTELGEAVRQALKENSSG